MILFVNLWALNDQKVFIDILNIGRIKRPILKLETLNMIVFFINRTMIKSINNCYKLFTLAAADGVAIVRRDGFELHFVAFGTVMFRDTIVNVVCLFVL